ncbi:MAG: hypothetical protein OXH04_05290 [Acidobacteria bacterium]|nr:hypothetical protein [Acidobacteriota bacterium]
MGVAEAQPHIVRARRQLERVQVAAWEPPDAEQAVTWAFYAYENCIVALAELHALRWKKNHREKAEMARRLHADGLVSRDVGDTLEELNRLRMDVAYDEPGPELRDTDLEVLAGDLEAFVDEIGDAIDAHAGPDD